MILLHFLSLHRGVCVYMRSRVLELIFASAHTMVFQTPLLIISTAYESTVAVSSLVYVCVQSEGTFRVTARHFRRVASHGETHMTLETNQFAGSTLTQVAKGYLVAKTRKDALAYLSAKAEVTKRKRWLNAHKAALAGDDLRMAAYAAEGREATSAAWAAVPRADAKPKASTPAKPKAKAKAKAPAKPKANPSAMDALTEQVLALDEAAFTAFTTALIEAKRTK